MKKLIALILALIMVFSMVACAGGKETENETEENGKSTETEAQSEAQTEAQTDAVDNTVSGSFVKVFKDAVAANPEGTAVDYANKLLEAQLAPYMMGVMALSDIAGPDEEGKVYLPGFDNFDFSKVDISNSAVYMPMMGSIAFVSYVFILEDSAAASDLVETLKANCNPRWQICVAADETVAVNVENRVFFIMCPSTFEDEMGGEMVDEF